VLSILKRSEHVPNLAIAPLADVPLRKLEVAHPSANRCLNLTENHAFRGIVISVDGKKLVKGVTGAANGQKKWDELAHRLRQLEERREILEKSSRQRG